MGSRYVARVVLTVALGTGSALVAVPVAAQEGPAPAPEAAAPESAEAVPEAAIAGNWASVSAGETSLCGVKDNGRLFCAGSDSQGQLGDGQPRALRWDVFVEVAGGATNWAQVSVGDDHACAVKTTGQLWCWGDDEFGQLGNGVPLTDALRPVRVGSATNWASVSAGGNHTCARNNAGQVSCFGRDDVGQLGHGGASTDSATPQVVPAAPGTTWRNVSAGRFSTCGVRSNGRAYCWGGDDEGLLGDGGGETGQQAPVQVAGAATDWASTSVGDRHVCGRRTTGRLYCWGSDMDGELGDGTASASSTSPVQVTGAATNWSSVDAYLHHTCARKTTGRLYCWGDDTAGLLGDGGADTDSATPVEVSGAASDWRAPATGDGISCATKTSGRLLCWGPEAGRVNGDAGGTNIPDEALDAVDFAEVQTGATHSCGRTLLGRLYCWGEDGDGQLGEGPGTADQLLPVEVAGGVTTWRSFSLGFAHTCAVRSTGRLDCWGDDTTGQLGNGVPAGDRQAPARVGTSTFWVAVDAGGRNTCGVTTNDNLFCWGSESDGQLGDGANVFNRGEPFPLAGADWESVSTGTTTCAVKTTGRLYCWGDDEDGQVGNGGANLDRDLPTQVSGAATNWDSVSVGGGHVCARKGSGRIYCWGNDDSGELGDDVTLAAMDVPTEVNGGATDWTSVDAGGDHTCAGKSTGRLLCWGDDVGQLGDDAPLVDQPIPTEVANAWPAWDAVSAGGEHTCGRIGKRLLCWGRDGSGQLGDDTTLADQPEPVQVLF